MIHTRTRFTNVSGRNVGLTLAQVVGPGVVDSVASLPREVGHKQHGVVHITHCVLQNFVVGESIVATLMGHDPNSSGNGACHHGVGQPKRDGPESVGDHCSPYNEAQEQEGSRKGSIVKASCCVSYSTVGRDSLIMISKMYV